MLQCETAMRIFDIIKKKRDGYALSEPEIAYVIGKYLSGEIPDHQVSALLMAIFLKGMTNAETASLTRQMRSSGLVMDLSDIPYPKIDKHSTGGVGDKTSIVLAPLVAAAGITVPMIAGKSLGHTGGTIDKLESIPGFRTEVSVQEFNETLRRIGVSIIGQTVEIAPADKKLYALRDATATIDSAPLIASSIMSKKLAEGIQGLVLDVKVGSGAFMKTINEARKLAETMVHIGESMGVKTVAVLTDMEEPLGKTIGNSLEIKECIAALRGKWPDDLSKVTLALGTWMIHLATLVSDFTFFYSGEVYTGFTGYQEGLRELITTGAAFKKFVEMVDAQHGDPEVAFQPFRMASAKIVKQILSEREGYIQRMDAEMAGVSAMLLGAGRQNNEDSIDHSAGIILNRKTGDYVMKGEQIALFHYNREDHIKEAEEVFLSGITIGPEKVKKRDPVLEVISEIAHESR
jgi:pyrimidine-nucleoside phosphorylase